MSMTLNIPDDIVAAIKWPRKQLDRQLVVDPRPLFTWRESDNLSRTGFWLRQSFREQLLREAGE